MNSNIATQTTIRSLEDDLILKNRAGKVATYNGQAPHKSLTPAVVSATTAVDASLASLRTLDQFWDLLDKSLQSHQVYSIDDAVFSTEEEELRFWATLEAESADSSECRSP